jgi:hypothetical protein
MSKTSGELIVRVSLELRDREIRNVADIDTLLNEIRKRLLPNCQHAARHRGPQSLTNRARTRTRR